MAQNTDATLWRVAIGERNLEHWDLQKTWKTNAGTKTFTAPLGIVYFNEKEGMIAEIEITQKDKAHGIIFANTESEKFIVLETMIAGISAKYSPETVNFVYLSDNDPSPFVKKLPHINTSTYQQPSLEALEMFLKNEIRKREDYARQKNLTHISPADMPSILVIIEGLNDNNLDIAEHITSVGRVLGIHLILIHRTTSQYKVPPELAAQFGWTITFNPIEKTTPQQSNSLNEQLQKSKTIILSTSDISEEVDLFNLQNSQEIDKLISKLHNRNTKLNSTS